MKHSLIICTRNRGDRLEGCLNAIAALGPAPDFEVVFVDNASTDNTRVVLEAFDPSFPVTIVSEPTPGLGRARNTGWQASRGDIVTFTDDDCYVFPDYIAQVARVFEDRPDIDFFAGRVMLHNPEHVRVTIREDMVAEEMPAYRFLVAGCIHGANFGFRRSLLEKLNGFDNRLGAGTPFASEDIEILGRAVGSGHAGVYDPRPAVSHDHGRGPGVNLEPLLRSYSIGRGAYYYSMLTIPSMRDVAIRHWLSTFPVAKRPRRLFSKIRHFGYEIYGAIAFARTQK